MSVRLTCIPIYRHGYAFSWNQTSQMLRNLSSIDHSSLKCKSIAPLLPLPSLAFSSMRSNGSKSMDISKFSRSRSRALMYFQENYLFNNFAERDPDCGQSQLLHFHSINQKGKGQGKANSSRKTSVNFSFLGKVSGWCLIGLGIYKMFSSYSMSDIIPSVQADNHNKNNFIADVVEKAAPAVVFLEILGRHPLSGREVTISNGSGFIVRSHGVILTNAHVVANKTAVSVKLHDGSIHQGQVTAVDPVSDLATVKIPASNLPTIPLGDSSKLRPGEWVIALGSPLSLSNTVTCGIVSSVQRGSKELGLRNKDMDYIQTDAVINFGNSGGPLVDLEGRAIGINTMKVTTGISFAIPSDHAMKFLNKAEVMMKRGSKDAGYMKRRYMGITMLTLTDSIIRELQKDRLTEFRNVTGGVFVYKVIPGSPAHTAGLLAGDIIVEIDSRPVKSAADVYDAVEKSEHLIVSIIRGQTKKSFGVNTKETI